MTYEELVAQVQASASKMDAKAITDHLAVQFNVEGEAEGAFYLEISSGHISVEPYEYYDHDVVVIASAKQILDVFSGKLDPAKALEAGKIKAEGNGSRIGLLNEILKKTPEKKPAAKKAAPKKAEEKKPAAKAEEKKPAAKAEEKKPAAKAEEKKPAAKAEEKKPAAAKVEEKKPAAKAEEKKPAAKVEEKKTAEVKKAEEKKTEAPKKAAAKKTK